MTALKQVAVIVPVYRNDISAFEQVALKQLHSILHAYPTIVIKPRSLELSPQLKQFDFTAIESFDDHYFTNIQGYNALML
ncbi:MAG TPA: hypothetical protein VIM77_02270, partial [Mucilaginibacter sp.]